jgi:dynein assembly factor 1
MMFPSSNKGSKVEQWLAKKSVGKIDHDDNGTPLMTPGTLRCCAVQNDGFETPECNDKLYLHFKGFKRIENLEPYTNLKCVWLESNGLANIEGLETCVELRSLYLQQNLIKKITGLSTLINLVTLDLSQNLIEHVDGLSCLPKLNILNLSQNALSTVESVSHLVECVSLTNVDLSGNQLKDSEVIDQVLAHIPKLSAVYLKGNPLVTKTKHFRRRVLSTVPKLLHLDDMPVFEKERICVEAWKVGGKEAEKIAREEIIAKAKQEDREYVASFRKWRQDKVSNKQQVFFFDLAAKIYS